MFERIKIFVCKHFGHATLNFEDYDFGDEIVEYWYCPRCRKDIRVVNYNKERV